MYKALLFHPEGDFVTDAKDSKSIQDVWDQAARELQMDYTAVDFDGVTYWVR